jgi:prepilin-type N-terminal cleavage/methylation domain-containing protein
MCILDQNFSRRARTALPRCRCGFTLIEIIAVVVILAIAALIAIPAFSGASEMQLKAAADKLAADLEYAKSMAVTTQTVYRVTFDTNAESYSIIDTSTNQVIADPVSKSPFTVTYPQESRLSKVGIRSASLGSTAGVQFDATGAPQNTAGTAMTTAGTVVLEANGQTLTVTVQPITGYVSIQ